MSLKKPSIPTIQTTDRTLGLAIAAIKENIEIMNGSRANIGVISQLPAAATNEEIVSKINEVIARLNFSGE
jgi:hypothetical protein